LFPEATTPRIVMLKVPVVGALLLVKVLGFGLEKVRALV